MVDSFASHRDLIDRWPAPSLRTFADDLGEAYGTVKAMRRRNSISVEHWATVVAKAAERGICGVTFEALALTTPKRSTPTPINEGVVG